MSGDFDFAPARFGTDPPLIFSSGFENQFTLGVR